MKRWSAVRAGTDADALAVQDGRYIAGMGAGRGKRQDRTGLFGIAKDGDARNSRESGPRVATKRGLVGRDTRTSHTLDIVARSDKSDRFEDWGRYGFGLVRRGHTISGIAPRRERVCQAVES